MAELRSAIFWVLNCPIYLLRCYIFLNSSIIISIILFVKSLLKKSSSFLNVNTKFFG
ncbi:MAG: hypothetical protein IM583_08025 [Pseudanabaena sp. M114S2SP2A07QC]|nr:hypothetical protein [Pseudanabaena sp. M090S1SP2A07QC]MCA6507900.1 hypothetical protein [Pseudanabaena sp. M172S2SP2A07QC]MCA6527309.1 hypothetical protein [Pseudanabaena sp. M179S2SP2A07QC]MCA6534913.1 hypothetical protein [Pseudanabaena sp. M176S2SP2A07QC]MCA6541404.1 hypothetical protein [Pseudanabaena sp. M037S2SP2A07QC]MCA6556564.1 hypothetical protein [Pseudanabaena sp. M114S2SP2A07QC]MCA6561346.1 hypothetical protein [Pseudanabaena sp. M079S1SP2A07QC]MCA6563710.1 hypothetical prot